MKNHKVYTLQDTQQFSVQFVEMYSVIHVVSIEGV